MCLFKILSTGLLPCLYAPMTPDLECWNPLDVHSTGMSSTATACCNGHTPDCFDFSFPKERCCSRLDRCEHLAFHTYVQLVFNGNMQFLSQTFQNNEFELDQTSQGDDYVRGGCPVMSQIAGIVNCKDLEAGNCMQYYLGAGSSVDWVDVMQHTDWPLFYLMKYRLRDWRAFMQGNANVTSLHQKQQVVMHDLRLVAKNLETERDLIGGIPKTMIDAAVQVVRIAQNIWAETLHEITSEDSISNSSRSVSAAAAFPLGVEFFSHLATIHHALRHGHCGVFNLENMSDVFSIATRYPAKTNLSTRFCIARMDDPMTKGIVSTVARHGFWVDADWVTAMLHSVVQHAALEPQNCGMIDVGANLGTVTSHFARLGYKTLAIEADKILWRLCIERLLKRT